MKIICNRKDYNIVVGTIRCTFKASFNHLRPTISAASELVIPISIGFLSDRYGASSGFLDRNAFSTFWSSTTGKNVMNVRDVGSSRQI